MRRTATSTAIAVSLLLALTLSPAGAATPPANDDLADALPVSSLYFQATPDMSGATMEPDETACDESGGLMDQSIWYTWTFPAPAGMQIEINGLETGVTAAVYGPFDVLPTIAANLPDAIYCIYGTGAHQALTESYEAGSYLVQLTTVSVWGVTPSIRIEQQPLQLHPWLGSYSVDVQAGVPIHIDWGWFACTRGLTANATRAFDQSYALTRTDPDPAELLVLTPQEAAGYWGGLYRDDSMVDQCVAATPAGWSVRWTYDLPMLNPGMYQLATHVSLRHTITDGADMADGDGRPDLYRPGPMLEESITINVLPVAD